MFKRFFVYGVFLTLALAWLPISNSAQAQTADDFHVAVLHDGSGVEVIGMAGTPAASIMPFTLLADMVDLTDTGQVLGEIDKQGVPSSARMGLANRVLDIWASEQNRPAEEAERRREATRFDAIDGLEKQLGDDIDYGLKLYTTLGNNHTLAVNLTTGGLEYAKLFETGLGSATLGFTPRVVLGGYFGVGDAEYVGGGLALDVGFRAGDVMQMKFGLDGGTLFVYAHGTYSARGEDFTEELDGIQWSSGARLYADTVFAFGGWRITARADTRSVVQLGAGVGGFSFDANTEGGGRLGYRFRF